MQKDEVAALTQEQFEQAILNCFNDPGSDPNDDIMPWLNDDGSIEWIFRREWHIRFGKLVIYESVKLAIKDLFASD